MTIWLEVQQSVFTLQVFFENHVVIKSLIFMMNSSPVYNNRGSSNPVTDFTPHHFNRP